MLSGTLSLPVLRGAMGNMMDVQHESLSVQHYKVSLSVYYGLPAHIVKRRAPDPREQLASLHQGGNSGITVLQMVGSHALQMSRRGTAESDAEDKSAPLAAKADSLPPKPADPQRRSSLVGVSSPWTHSKTDDAHLNAILQLREDPRRASMAIRRQSVLQTQQMAMDGDSEPEPRAQQRSSVSAYRRQSMAGGRQSMVAERKVSIAESRRDSLMERRSSTAVSERRASQAPVVRQARRSSVMDRVQDSSLQAVRRASLAM